MEVHPASSIGRPYAFFWGNVGNFGVQQLYCWLSAINHQQSAVSFQLHLGVIVCALHRDLKAEG
jgi:hypothetical protein